MMSDTNEFVEKIHEKQRKAKENENHQGRGDKSLKLPNKKH